MHHIGLEKWWEDVGLHKACGDGMHHMKCQRGSNESGVFSLIAGANKRMPSVRRGRVGIWGEEEEEDDDDEMERCSDLIMESCGDKEWE